MAEMPLRKVLLTGDNVGGVWSFGLELAEGLIRRGMHVLLATFGRAATPPQKAEVAAIGGLEWHASDYKLEWMEEPWKDVERSRDWVLQLAREFQPDVVHLNTLVQGDLDWPQSVVITVHSCVASWWEAVKHESPPSAWDRYRRAVGASLAVADVVITPSYAMLQAARSHYAFPCGRVVYNGRRPDRFHSAAKEPFVLTAGRLWDEAKNVAALADVAPTLTWPVYLAGEPVALSGCHPLGHLNANEMSAWFARAAIYALPAHYEPFGLSILEAAMSGCALVLGDIASLREIWGNAAVFVHPDNRNQLRAALQLLIEDAGYRAEMASRAFRRAQRYTQPRMAEDYLDSYQLARQRKHQQRRLACAS